MTEKKQRIDNASVVRSRQIQLLSKIPTSMVYAIVQYMSAQELTSIANVLHRARQNPVSVASWLDKVRHLHFGKAEDQLVRDSYQYSEKGNFDLLLEHVAPRLVSLTFSDVLLPDVFHFDADHDGRKTFDERITSDMPLLETLELKQVHDEREGIPVLLRQLAARHPPKLAHFFCNEWGREGDVIPDSDEIKSLKTIVSRLKSFGWQYGGGAWTPQQYQTSFYIFHERVEKIVLDLESTATMVRYMAKTCPRLVHLELTMPDVAQTDPWGADDLSQLFTNCKKLRLLSLRSTCLSETKMNVDFGMTWTRGDEKDTWSLLQSTTIDPEDERFLTKRAFHQSWLAFLSQSQWKRAGVIVASFATFEQRVVKNGIPKSVEHLTIVTRSPRQRPVRFLPVHTYWPNLTSSEWMTWWKSESYSVKGGELVWRDDDDGKQGPVPEINATIEIGVRVDDSRYLEYPKGIDEGSLYEWLDKNHGMMCVTDEKTGHLYLARRQVDYSEKNWNKLATSQWPLSTREEDDMRLVLNNLNISAFTFGIFRVVEDKMFFVDAFMPTA